MSAYKLKKLGAAPETWAGYGVYTDKQLDAIDRATDKAFQKYSNIGTPENPRWEESYLTYAPSGAPAAVKEFNRDVRSQMPARREKYNMEMDRRNKSRNNGTGVINATIVSRNSALGTPFGE